MSQIITAALAFTLVVSLTMLGAGCATKYVTVTPEIHSQMMEDLKAGNLTLDCGVQCLLSWNQALPNLAALDTAENWQELAVGVMKIGYRQDLAYYYLGQAAQGLGYHEAAIKYYRYAGALANDPDPTVRCGQDSCEGVNLAVSLPVLIQASQNALAQQAASQAQPTSQAQNSSGWIMPPPPSK